MIRLLRLLTLALFVLLLAPPSRALAAGPNDGLQSDPTLDRATPRRALEGFLRAGDHGEFVRAAHYLDLRAIPKARQATEGPELAEKLWYVMAHAGQVPLAKVSDEPDTPMPPSSQGLTVATITVADDALPIAMTRATFDDGVQRWVISRGTVAMAPVLYSSMAPNAWEEKLPDSLKVTVLGNAIWQWIGLYVAIPLAYALARALAYLLVRVGRWLARRTRTKADDLLIEKVRRPLRLAIGAGLYDLLTDPLHATLGVDHLVDHVTVSLLVVAAAWFLLGAIDALTHWVEERLPPTKNDTMYRSMRTRMAVFERVADVLVVVLAIAVLLLQFEVVRTVGVSLLASAGIAGVVVGFAAQKSLGAIIAGVQISVTQPIRIGDLVVVEGETGTIEAIYLTYVVVRVWDERRLVVPASRFLDQPFQNLSKGGIGSTGTVSIPCDFSTPVDLVRRELERVVRANPKWDGRTCTLQVTDASERAIVLRAVVSAADSGACWDLRCDVRERLVRFLHDLEGGKYLARTRGDFPWAAHGDGRANGGAAMQS